MADGYPHNKETSFLAWEWTHKFREGLGYAPYSPELQDLTDYGIHQLQDGMKDFGVLLADIATDFIKKPKFQDIPSETM
eukprot:6263429-Ditylum_brightwellii.AAC.1